METELTLRTQKMESLLYLLAIALAAGLRFIKLGSLPLGESEAAVALQALDLVKGNATTIGGQPGYLALTSFLFSIFNSSNFWALFWPAAFGTAIVLLPLLFRNWLGRNASLILAFLLALDPGLTAVSRTAGGEMMVVVSLLAALGFLLHKRSIPAGISAGLALLGGTAFWPGLIMLGIVALICHFSSIDRSGSKFIFSGLKWIQFLTGFGVTVGFLGTGFLIHPAIINGVGSGFYEYFHSFVVKDGVSGAVVLLGLALSEVLILPLAIGGFIAGLKKKDLATELLGYAVVLTAALALMNPSRQMIDWVWTILPLAVLAAKGGAQIIEQYAKQETVVVVIQAGLTVILIVFSYLNLIMTLANMPADVAVLRNAILEIILPLVFLVLITFLLAWGWSRKASMQGFLIGIGAILVFVSFGNTWKAAGLGPRPENELWREDALPVGSELLTGTTHQLSLYNNGQADRIDITILDIESAALRWCLHDYGKLESTNVLGATGMPSIVLSRLEKQFETLDSYRGQSIHWTTSPDYDNMTALDWLKWFAFREVPQRDEHILLWARNDLFYSSNTN